MGTSESLPFDNEILVFKVSNKIFALINIVKLESINLKYYPETIEEIRASDIAVKPGYHMNKNHWNTVMLCDINWNELKNYIDISYQLVLNTLSKKTRDTMQNK